MLTLDGKEGEGQANAEITEKMPKFFKTIDFYTAHQDILINFVI